MGFDFAHSELGSDTCICDEGFTFNMKADPNTYSNFSPCDDVDECADPRYSGNGTFAGEFEGGQLCDPLAIRPQCRNTPGGYNCSTCPAGFEGAGSTGCWLPKIDVSLGEAPAEPQVTLVMPASEEVLEDGPLQEAYIAGLVADIAASLGVDPSEIEIDNIRAVEEGNAVANTEDGVSGDLEPEGIGRRSLLQFYVDGVLENIVVADTIRSRQRDEQFPRLPPEIISSPSLSQLRNLSAAAKRRVKGFMIQKPGCFSIVFDGGTDVSRLDLTSQIQWERYGVHCVSVTLYPNASSKPNFEQELNKHATVTLNIEKNMDTADVLRLLEGDGGIQNPVYDSAVGLLSFRVSHFSAHGLEMDGRRQVQDGVASQDNQDNMEH